jgi:hypothetical protein
MACDLSSSVTGTGNSKLSIRQGSAVNRSRQRDKAYRQEHDQRWQIEGDEAVKLSCPRESWAALEIMNDEIEWQRHRWGWDQGPWFRPIIGLTFCHKALQPLHRDSFEGIVTISWCRQRLTRWAWSIRGGQFNDVIYRCFEFQFSSAQSRQLAEHQWIV